MIHPPLNLALPEGSNWPRPAMERDEHYGIGHRLRYASEITMGDRLIAASIIDAYGYLIFMPRRRRETVIREIRNALEREIADD